MNKYQEALDIFNEIVIRVNYYGGYFISMSDLEHLIEATKILQELVDKATPKKPLIKYYGEEGNKSIKVCCPNGCGIQLNGLDKEGESRAYTNDYCNKCGQAIDWTSDE